ncbi:hypothetical protein BDZ89DRAFT_207545 [Hymenopellis radicata]|nr:hypothetical protein BDZ89DRAFT_207545 [Hymenopellis radicata]
MTSPHHQGKIPWHCLTDHVDFDGSTYGVQSPLAAACPTRCSGNVVWRERSVTHTIRSINDSHNRRATKSCIVSSGLADASCDPVLLSTYIQMHRRLCTSTAAVFGGLMAWGGYRNGHGAAFYYGVGAATALLLRVLSQVDVDDPEQCMECFLMTPLVGGIVLVGSVADCVMHRLNEGILL